LFEILRTFVKKKKKKKKKKTNHKVPTQMRRHASCNNLHVPAIDMLGT